MWTNNNNKHTKTDLIVWICLRFPPDRVGSTEILFCFYATLTTLTNQQCRWQSHKLEDNEPLSMQGSVRSAWSNMSSAKSNQQLLHFVHWTYFDIVFFSLNLCRPMDVINSNMRYIYVHVHPLMNTSFIWIDTESLLLRYTQLTPYSFWAPK